MGDGTGGFIHALLTKESTEAHLGGVPRLLPNYHSRTSLRILCHNLPKQNENTALLTSDHRLFLRMRCDKRCPEMSM
jgi:hypothetical protein